MWNPFSKKAEAEEQAKKKSKAQSIIQRLQEPDSADIKAEEALKKSADACTMSGIMDDEAMAKLKEARLRTETLRRKVKKNQSSILEGDENETVQERALRELAELEAEEERERAAS